MRSQLVMVLVVAAVGIAALGCGSAEPVRAEIVVDGMHCDGCSSAITDELGGIDGVVEASADWETGRATAVYDPTAVTEEQLSSAVESLGYDVVTVTVEPAGGS